MASCFILLEFTRAGLRSVLGGRQLLNGSVGAARSALRLRACGARARRPGARVPSQHGAVRQPVAVTAALRPQFQVRTFCRILGGLGAVWHRN